MSERRDEAQDQISGEDACPTRREPILTEQRAPSLWCCIGAHADALHGEISSQNYKLISIPRKWVSSRPRPNKLQLQRSTSHQVLTQHEIIPFQSRNRIGTLNYSDETLSELSWQTLSFGQNSLLHHVRVEFTLLSLLSSALASTDRPIHTCSLNLSHIQLAPTSLKTVDLTTTAAHFSVIPNSTTRLDEDSTAASVSAVVTVWWETIQQGRLKKMQEG